MARHRPATATTLKNAMPATANRIARAFAEQTHTQKPAAMQLLFEEFDDGREAKRRAEANDAAS